MKTTSQNKKINLGLIEKSENLINDPIRTTLKFPNGDDEQFENKLPVHFFGVHALVNIKDNEFHLMEEDDGFFRTHSVLTKDEVEELHQIVKKLTNEFEITSKWKTKIKNVKKFLMERKHPKFPIKFILHDSKNIEIQINIHNNSMNMDVFWLFNLEKVLNIN
jgi:hypothetical protein